MHWRTVLITATQLRVLDALENSSNHSYAVRVLDALENSSNHSYAVRTLDALENSSNHSYAVRVLDALDTQNQSESVGVSGIIYIHCTDAHTTSKFTEAIHLR